MSAADKSMKDKMMAARLKAEGDERRHCRCPMCHGVVALAQLYAHLSKHAGGVGGGAEGGG